MSVCFKTVLFVSFVIFYGCNADLSIPKPDQLETKVIAESLDGRPLLPSLHILKEENGKIIKKVVNDLPNEKDMHQKFPIEEVSDKERESSNDKIISNEKEISDEKVISDQNVISDQKVISNEKLRSDEKLISNEKVISNEPVISNEKLASNEKENQSIIIQQETNITNTVSKVNNQSSNLNLNQDSEKKTARDMRLTFNSSTSEEVIKESSVHSSAGNTDFEGKDNITTHIGNFTATENDIKKNITSVKNPNNSTSREEHKLRRSNQKPASLQMRQKQSSHRPHRRRITHHFKHKININEETITKLIPDDELIITTPRQRHYRPTKRYYHPKAIRYTSNDVNQQNASLVENSNSTQNPNQTDSITNKNISNMIHRPKLEGHQNQHRFISNPRRNHSPRFHSKSIAVESSENTNGTNSQKKTHYRPIQHQYIHSSSRNHSLPELNSSKNKTVDDSVNSNHNESNIHRKTHYRPVQRHFTHSSRYHPKSLTDLKSFENKTVDKTPNSNQNETDSHRENHYRPVGHHHNEVFKNPNLVSNKVVNQHRNPSRVITSHHSNNTAVNEQSNEKVPHRNRPQHTNFNSRRYHHKSLKESITPKPTTESISNPDVMSDVTTTRYQKYRQNQRYNFGQHPLNLRNKLNLNSQSKNTTKVIKNTNDENTTDSPTTGIYEKFRHHQMKTFTKNSQIGKKDLVSVEPNLSSNSSQIESINNDESEIVTRRTYQRVRNYRPPVHMKPKSESQLKNLEKKEIVKENLQLGTEDESSTITEIPSTTNTYRKYNNRIHIRPRFQHQPHIYTNSKLVKNDENDTTTESIIDKNVTGSDTNMETPSTTSIYQRFQHRSHMHINAKPESLVNTLEPSLTNDKNGTTSDISSATNINSKYKKRIHIKPNHSTEESNIHPNENSNSDNNIKDVPSTTSVYQRFQHRPHMRINLKPESLGTNTEKGTTKESIKDTSERNNNDNMDDVPPTTNVYQRFQRRPHMHKNLKPESLGTNTEKGTTKESITDTSESNNNDNMDDVPSTTNVYQRFQHRPHMHINLKPESLGTNTEKGTTKESITDTSESNNNDNMDDVPSTTNVYQRFQHRPHMHINLKPESLGTNTEKGTTKESIKDTSESNNNDNMDDVPSTTSVYQRFQHRPHMHINLRPELLVTNIENGTTAESITDRNENTNSENMIDVPSTTSIYQRFQHRPHIHINSNPEVKDDYLDPKKSSLTNNDNKTEIPTVNIYSKFRKRIHIKPDKPINSKVEANTDNDEVPRPHYKIPSNMIPHRDPILFISSEEFANLKNSKLPNNLDSNTNIESTNNVTKLKNMKIVDLVNSDLEGRNLKLDDLDRSSHLLKRRSRENSSYNKRLNESETNEFRPDKKNPEIKELPNLFSTSGDNDESLFETYHPAEEYSLFDVEVELNPTVTPIEKVTLSLPKSFIDGHSSSGKTEEDTESTGLANKDEMTHMQEYIDSRSDLYLNESETGTIDPNHWFGVNDEEDTSTRTEGNSNTILNNIESRLAENIDELINNPSIAVSNVETNIFKEKNINDTNSTNNTADTKEDIKNENRMIFPDDFSLTGSIKIDNNTNKLNKSNKEEINIPLQSNKEKEKIISISSISKDSKKESNGMNDKLKTENNSKLSNEKIHMTSTLKIDENKTDLTTEKLTLNDFFVSNDSKVKNNTKINKDNDTSAENIHNNKEKIIIGVNAITSENNNSITTVSEEKNATKISEMNEKTKDEENNKTVIVVAKSSQNNNSITTELSENTNDSKINEDSKENVNNNNKTNIRHSINIEDKTVQNNNSITNKFSEEANPRINRKNNEKTNENVNNNTKRTVLHPTINFDATESQDNISTTDNVFKKVNKSKTNENIKENINNDTKNTDLHPIKSIDDKTMRVDETTSQNNNSISNKLSEEKNITKNSQINEKTATNINNNDRLQTTYTENKTIVAEPKATTAISEAANSIKNINIIEENGNNNTHQTDILPLTNSENTTVISDTEISKNNKINETVSPVNYSESKEENNTELSNNKLILDPSTKNKTIKIEENIGDNNNNSDNLPKNVSSSKSFDTTNNIDQKIIFSIDTTPVSNNINKEVEPPIDNKSTLLNENINVNNNSIISTDQNNTSTEESTEKYIEINTLINSFNEQIDITDIDIDELVNESQTTDEKSENVNISADKKYISYIQVIPKKPWSKDEIDIEEHEIVDSNLPFISANILGNLVNISITVKIKNNTVYIPSNVKITEDMGNNALHFSWSIDKDTKYSLTMILTENESKYYEIDSVQLYHIKDGNVFVWKKNVSIQPKKDGTVDHVLNAHLDDDVHVIFSNAKFLEISKDRKKIEDIQSAASENNRQIRIVHVEIALGVLAVLCAVVIILYIIIRKIKIRAIKKKNKVPTS